MKKIILTSFLMLFTTVSCVTNQDNIDTSKNDNINSVTTDFPSVYNDTRGRDTFPLKWDTHGRKLFVFDPAHAAWAAYNKKGHRIMTGGASGGKDYCVDTLSPCKTVMGNFVIYKKGDADCVSSKFPHSKDDTEIGGGASMAYCMFFYKGYAIHASENVREYNASHGCIRVFPDAAKWLNLNFVNIGTHVLVLPYPQMKSE